MTKGKFYLLYNDVVFSSVEFNRGMCYDGYGKEAYEMLERIVTPISFEREIREFNKKNFGYKGTLVRSFNLTEDFLNMSKDYDDVHGSDYLFIKNESGNDITIKKGNGGVLVLANGSRFVLYFGDIAESFLELGSLEKNNVEDGYERVLSLTINKNTKYIKGCGGDFVKSDAELENCISNILNSKEDGTYELNIKLD